VRATSAAIGGAALLAGAAGLGVGVYAVLVAPRRLRVRHRTLRLPGWPAELAGLRIALVSDLHAGGPHVGPAEVARVAAAVQREAPDLVALLGDFVDPEVLGGGEVAPEAVAAPLGALRAPLGVLAVLGNHDWKTDGPRVAITLTAAGIRVLEDEALELRPGLWVAGLADATTRRPRPHAALAEVPDDATLVVLTHDPDLFPQIRGRAALTVAGHTHGAQVDLPGLAPRVIPSRFGARFKAGHIVEHGRHLFVTRGVGTSRWPVRLNAPPEVDVLRLEPERPDDGHPWDEDPAAWVREQRRADARRTG